MPRLGRWLLDQGLIGVRPFAVGIPLAKRKRIGNGFVGAMAGYALVMQGVWREVIASRSQTLFGNPLWRNSVSRLRCAPGELRFPDPASQTELGNQG
jgi:hypothetical protein